MSLKELFDEIVNNEWFLVFMVLFLVVVFAIGIPVGLSVAKKTNKKLYGEEPSGERREEQNVKIIARRSSPHPLTRTVMVNTVLFEFSNGERVELAIQDSEAYGKMAEGDVGTLCYQEKKFISFQRSVKREN